MQVNSKLRLDLNEAIKRADKIIQDKSSKLRLVCKIFFTKKKRNYLFLCYAYLRSVDNFIDDRIKTIDEKKNFIKNQKSLLTSLLNKNGANINSVPEHFLYYIIRYAHSTGNTSLPDELSNMIKTFEWDLQRLENNGIYSQNELEQYISNQATSLFSIIYCFFPDQNGEINIKSDTFSSLNYLFNLVFSSLHNLFMLGGFNEDLDSGYINITKEEFQIYDLNENDLANNEKLKVWVANKLALIEKLMDEQIAVVKTLPFKLKLYLYGFFPYQYIRIQRFKEYEYTIDDSDKKQFIKEVKVYLKTFIYEVKVFAEIFF